MTLQSALVALVLAPALCAASRHGRHHAGHALRSHRHIHHRAHRGHGHRAHEAAHEVVSRQDQALFAKSLAAVEDDWRSQVTLAKDCDDEADAGKCGKIQQSFRESCSAVSEKFVQVSGGSIGQIRRFMELVCGDAAMSDASRHSQCSSMAGGIVEAKEKSDKDHGSLDSALGAMCDRIWTSMLQDEVQSAPDQAEAQAVQAPAQLPLRASSPAAPPGPPPAQAAAEDPAGDQSPDAGHQSLAAPAPVAASAAAPALAASRPRPRLAAVATHASVGKAVLVVSGDGAKDDADEEGGGDSDGDAAGKEAGDSEDEEGDEDDGQKGDGSADETRQGDAKDGDRDEDADGDEGGDEEGDDNAD